MLYYLEILLFYPPPNKKDCHLFRDSLSLVKSQLFSCFHGRICHITYQMTVNRIVNVYPWSYIMVSGPLSVVIESKM